MAYFYFYLTMGPITVGSSRSSRASAPWWVMLMCLCFVALRLTVEREKTPAIMSSHKFN